MKVRYKINGKEVTRKEFEALPRIGGNGAPVIADVFSRKPIDSVALGVPRSQVEEFNAAYEKAGIAARHKPDGSIVIESRNVRNQLLRARGLIDQDAGYGDYAGR